MRLMLSGQPGQLGDKTTVKMGEEEGLLVVDTAPATEVELRLCVKNEYDTGKVDKEGSQENEEEREFFSADPAKGVVLKSVAILTDMDGFKLEGGRGKIKGATTNSYKCRNSAAPFPDGFGLTKPEREREKKLRPGVRILPSRKLAFTLNFMKESVGQHRVPIVAQVREEICEAGARLIWQKMSIFFTASHYRFAPTRPGRTAS